MTKACLVLKPKHKNSAWLYMLSKSEPTVTASRKPSHTHSTMLTGSFVILSSLVRVRLRAPEHALFLCVSLYECERLGGGAHQCLPDPLSEQGMLSLTVQPLSLCWACAVDQPTAFLP